MLIELKQKVVDMRRRRDGKRREGKGRRVTKKRVVYKRRCTC